VKLSSLKIGMSRKARIGAVEINLSRFGVSVNGLQERDNSRSALYMCPRRQPHLSAWEAFSQAAFPIPAKGLLFWTLPGRCHDTA